MNCLKSSEVFVFCVAAFYLRLDDVCCVRIVGDIVLQLLLFVSGQTNAFETGYS